MNRPKITLSPWEVAPDVEICPKAIGSFFDLQMSKDGLSRPVGVIKHPITKDGYHVNSLRFLDEEEEGNWVISSDYLSSLRKSSNIQPPWYLHRDKTEDYREFKRLFNACTLGIGDNDGLIIVGSYDSGLCVDIRWSYNIARFRLNSEIKQIFDAPFTVVKEALQREMLQPDSDVGFMFKWMSLPSFEEQLRLIYRTRRGEWDELTALFRAVNALLPEPINDSFALVESNIERAYEPIFGATNLLALRRYFWNLELIRYFQPFIVPELRHYTCVRDFSKGDGEMYYYEEDQTSAHDKIEATNILFDWAQDKMSPRKLKFLLPY